MAQHDLGLYLKFQIMWENKISVLDRPKNSLNLNPIENLWIIIKHTQLDLTTNKTYAIQDWFHDGNKIRLCIKPFLIESVPKRLKKVSCDKGGHATN